MNSFLNEISKRPGLLNNKQASSAPPVPSLIGFNQIGLNPDNLNAVYFGSVFSAAKSFPISVIRVYCAYPWDPVTTRNFIVSIWDLSGTTIGGLLAQSPGVGIYGGGLDWRSCNISYNYTAGQEIFLVAWPEDAMTAYYDTGDPNQGFDKWDQSYPTYQDPNLPGGINTYDRKYSIYAE